MKRATLLTTLVFGAMILDACDQEVKTGDPDQALERDGGADVALLEQGVQGDGTPGSPDGAPADGVGPADGQAGVTVDVTYKGQRITVALSQPTSVTFEGFASARLSALVSLALPQAQLNALAADFMSSDGFVSSSKSTCDGLVPVAGALFEKGYVDVATRKLRWDTALGYPGCLYVKDLAEIRLTDP